MINSAIWQSLVSTLFSLLFNLSFQIGVIVGLTLLCIRLMRIRSSDVRHLLWLMVLLSPLLLVLLELLFSFSFSLVEQARVVARAKLSAGDFKLAVEEPSSLLALMPEILILLWIAGAAVLLSRLVYSGFLRHRLLRSSIKVETGTRCHRSAGLPRAAQKLSELKENFKIEADVRLFINTRLPIPASFGYFRPVIMLPMHVLATLTEKQLEMMLSHELAHVKRCDYLISLCQRILGAIFFFHPLFYFASRQLDREREYICDDWVVQLTEVRGAYAECLVQTIEAGWVSRSASRMNTVSWIGSFKDILKRIDRIMEGGNMRTKLSRKLTFSLLIGMCVFVALVSIVKLVQNDDKQNETVLLARVRTRARGAILPQAFRDEVTSKTKTIPSQEVRGHKASAAERDVFSKQKLEETAELGPIELVGIPSQTSPPLMEKAAEGKRGRRAPFGAHRTALGTHGTATEPKERTESLKVESTSDVQMLTPISPSQSKVTSLIQAAMRPPGPGEFLSHTHRFGSVTLGSSSPISRENAAAIIELQRLRQKEAELKISKISDVLRKSEENLSRKKTLRVLAKLVEEKTRR